MTTHSQRALAQIGIVLLVLAVADAVICVLRWDVVSAIYFPDLKTVLLNGAILLLFLLGTAQLYRGFYHYAREERRIGEYLRQRAQGLDSEAILDDPDEDSLIAERFYTIKDLFTRGVPINHSAISAIMVADESLYQSFPRFVNNVLILTGVFGTVSSLIFALVGASDVLQTAVPGEGMGVMLLGMNTALTTTATAIVCYFVFTYFYQKLTDVQTYLLSRVEQAVLLHVIPEFAFDPETVNHQTAALIREVNGLVDRLHRSAGNVEQVVVNMDNRDAERTAALSALAAGQEQRGRTATEVAEHLRDLRELLVEGFRLTR